MLTFIDNGPERGDATQAYSIKLDKQYTVESFINTIFKEEPIFCRWGKIRLFADVNAEYPAGECEYNSGAIINKPLHPALLKLNVVAAKADGGWSRMDFDLIVN